MTPPANSVIQDVRAHGEGRLATITVNKQQGGQGLHGRRLSGMLALPPTEAGGSGSVRPVAPPSCCKGPTL